MYLISSLKNSATTTPGGHNKNKYSKNKYTDVWSQFNKIKSIKDWNEIIRKIHLSSELLSKRAKFIKLVKSTFNDR